VPTPQNREEVLFALALEKQADKRPALLDAICGGDPAVRQRVEALLAAHDKTEALNSSEAPTAKATIKLDLVEAEDESIGKTVGRYKILEKVGEGGCGVVYVAEQTEPVRRRVALKVIKLGMDTKQVIARFEAERQALAMMDHPNIAKVLDAGATEAGRPFFVMELVRGIRITEYCDQASLTTTERLDLFIKVCQAIQHAHQKGIIHRDIKPSNILVTMHDGVPVPKVIDFGIAKATVGQTLTDKTLYTQLQQFIGTPAYMSPEQAEMSGLDIDTRSDIYSLGVMLYELLAGSTPFDATELMSRGIDVMRKTIREKEPVRPSTRLAALKGEELTTTAKRRSADTAKLLHQLKGDLDWIVMKCLEKDRTRRYETANGLATDLKRHLENEPVLARPPSAAYKFQKAIRRNKLAYAAALAITAALVVGTGVSVWQAKFALRALSETEKSRVAEKEQRLAAQKERDKANSAQAEAEIQRSAAEQARSEAQGESYAADINLAQQALDAYNLSRARQLLDLHRPASGQPDQRNWEWRYLWQQCRSDALLKFPVQSNGFSHVGVSFDGKWLAVAGLVDTKIPIFDISVPNAPRMVFELRGAKFNTELACSPREPILAYCDSDGLSETNIHRIHLWNFKTQSETLTWRLTNFCAGLAFSSDGQRLMTLVPGPQPLTSAGELAVWRCSDGAKLASVLIFGISDRAFERLASTSDLGVAAYCGSSNNLYVVDLTGGTNRWVAKTRGKGSVFEAVAISPDGKLLVSAEGDPKPLIRFWDLATGDELGAPLAAHESFIMALRFLPDGRTLVSGGGDYTIRLWDVSEPRNVRAKGHPLLGQESWAISIAAMPDGKTLFSGAEDGSVCVWDISGARPDDSHWQVTRPNQGRTWEFASDSKSIFTLDVKGLVVQWHGTRFDVRTTLLDVSRVGTLWGDFSKDARQFVNVTSNGVVQVYNLAERTLVRQFGSYPGAVRGFVRPKKLLLYHADNVDHLLNGADLDEWDLDSFQLIKSWKVSGFPYPSTVSNDGQRLLTSDRNGSFTLVNFTTRQIVNPQLNINQGDGPNCFSADGSRFASSSRLGYAHIWDTESFQLLASMGDPRRQMTVQSFSPDGTRLLTKGVGDAGSEILRLWDIKTQRELISLPGRPDMIISPDGNVIVCSDNDSMQFYRAPTLAEIDAAEAAEKQRQQP
jgi:serine/threonine protein kinase/WD40 repeat protein